jgi:hypothetical protein
MTRRERHREQEDSKEERNILPLEFCFLWIFFRFLLARTSEDKMQDADYGESL